MFRYLRPHGTTSFGYGSFTPFGPRPSAVSEGLSRVDREGADGGVGFESRSTAERVVGLGVLGLSLVKSH